MVATAAAVLACCGRGHKEATYAGPTPDETRAILVAEHFILVNGYTSAIPDPKQIRPELMERGAPPSVVWRVHHNTLQPKAYGISAEVGAGQPGWTVFFEPVGGGDYLRGVEMSADLKEMSMCHYELRLDAPSKVLRARSIVAPDGARGRRTKG